MLKENKIFESPSSLACKERFAEQLNPVLAFVRKACSLDIKAASVERKELYQAYYRWHFRNIDEFALSRKNFFEILRQEFPSIWEVRINGIDYFKGVKILDTTLRGNWGKLK